MRENFREEMSDTHQVRKARAASNICQYVGEEKPQDVCVYLSQVDRTELWLLMLVLTSLSVNS